MRLTAVFPWWSGGLLLWLSANAWGDQPLTLQSTPLQPQFRVYSTEDGLPSSQVRALLQDHDGLLWIATFGGLASFDGQRFESWLAPDDPRPLTAETLLETRDGRLWIAAEKRGLYALDPSRTQWMHYSTSAKGAQRIVTDDVWAMLENTDGGFWLAGYGGGLQRIDAAGNAEPPTAQWANLVDSESISAIGRSDDRGLWLGTIDGLWYWPRDAARAQQCEGAGSGAVLSIRSAPGAVWVASNDGQLRRFSHDCSDMQVMFKAGEIEQSPQSVLLEGGQVRAVGLRSGLAWHAADDSQATDLRWIRPRFGTRGALPPAHVLAMLKDREGGYWLGLFGGGIAWLPPLAAQWAVLPHDPVSPGGLAGRVIRDAVAAPDGALWIASPEIGLERLDPQQRAVQRWEPPIELTSQPTSTWSVARDGERLWVGGRNYLWRGRLQGAELRYEQRLDEPRGVHLLLVQGAQLWAAARADALYRLDRDGKILERYAPGALAGDEVNQLLLDPAGRLWVASDGGLQRFDPASGRFGFGLPINHGDVASLCFHGDSLWRYVDAALEHWDADGQQRRERYDQAAGIPALDTVHLHCTGDEVWLLSRLGISRFDPATGLASAPLDRGDGLPGTELGTRQFAVHAAGRLWVGGDGALLGLPSQLPRPVPVGFTLRLHGSQIQRGDQWVRLDGADLQLQPDDRNLRIELRATQYWQAANTEYQFELAGVGAGRQLFEQRSPLLELPRLAPGDYQLKAQAHNPRLGDSLQPLTLRIKVWPPWWSTVWARVGFALLAGLLLAALIARSRQQLRRRHARQLQSQQLHFAERIAEEKSRFLAQTSHEMKNLLGGASGVAELIVGQSSEPPVRSKASRLVELCGELMRLLDDLLENARLERRQVQIEAQPFKLRQCLDDTLEPHLRKARSKGLTLLLDLPETRSERVGDALRFKQIVGNLLSNAVKYTERGSIHIVLDDHSETQLSLHVTDTGPGLAPGARERLFEPFALGRHRRDSTGLGLSICHQLVQLAGGRIEVQSDDAGTRFSVALPWPRAPLESPDACEPDNAPPWVIVADGDTLPEWQQAAAALKLPLRCFDSLLTLCADREALLASRPRRIVLPGASADTLELAHALLADWPGCPAIVVPVAGVAAARFLADAAKS